VTAAGKVVQVQIMPQATFTLSWHKRLLACHEGPYPMKTMQMKTTMTTTSMTTGSDEPTVNPVI